MAAIGSATLDIECDQENCHAVDMVVKGSLTKPIELTPHVEVEGVNTLGCLENSEAPSWEVASMLLNEIYRGEERDIRIGNVTVALKNHATNTTAVCDGQGDELNTDGESREPDRFWGCSYGSGGLQDYSTQQQFRFYPRTRVFDFQQTWFCNGHDSAPP